MFTFWQQGFIIEKYIGMSLLNGSERLPTEISKGYLCNEK